MPIALFMCLLLTVPMSRALDPIPPTAPPNAYWTGHGGFTDSCPYLCNAGYSRNGSACVYTLTSTTAIAPQPGATTSTTRAATQAATTTSSNPAVPTSGAISTTPTPTLPVSTTTPAPKPGVYLSFRLQYDSVATPTAEEITALRIKIAISLSINSAFISIKTALVMRRRLLSVSGYVLTVTIVLDTQDLANAVATQVASPSFQASLTAGSAVSIAYVQDSAAFLVVGLTQAPSPATTSAAASAPAPAPAPPGSGGGGAITATAAATSSSESQPSMAITAVAIAVPVVVVAAVVTGVALYLRQSAAAKAQLAADLKPVIPVKIDRTLPASARMSFTHNP